MDRRAGRSCDGRGGAGIRRNLAVTAGQAAAAEGRPEGQGAELELSFAPEVQLLADMPWNINWPPPKAGWDHTVKASAAGELLLSSDTTTSAVTALGVSVVTGYKVDPNADSVTGVGWNSCSKT